MNYTQYFSKKFKNTFTTSTIILAGASFSLFANDITTVQLVSKTNQAIVIDGQMNEAAWQQASWVSLDKAIIGELPGNSDFSGRYKLLWDKEHLYLLAEIEDDVLFDQHQDPLFKYWDDDCLEVFIDEDRSGGNHQFNFNAFAYHIALDGQSVDIGPNKADGSTNYILLNDHINVQRRRVDNSSNTYYWEAAIKVFDDSFSLSQDNNQPVVLTPNKDMGFMLAYCDNDGSEIRESFVGDVHITPVNGDKNLGYIDASVFAPIKLIDKW